MKKDKYLPFPLFRKGAFIPAISHNLDIFTPINQKSWLKRGQLLAAISFFSIFVRRWYCVVRRQIKGSPSFYLSLIKLSLLKVGGFPNSFVPGPQNLFDE